MKMPVIINSSVDSLYFSYKGTLEDQFLEILEDLKQRAIESGEEQAYEILGIKFFIMPYSWKNYKYNLNSSDFNLYATDSKKLPSVYIQAQASYLYQLGYKKAYKKIDDFILKSHIFKGETINNLSRIDLCTDFQGWVLELKDAKRIICRANKQSAHGLDKLETLTYGRGDIVMRIYNKTKQIKDKKIDWVEEIWKQSSLYDPKKQVWRVEIQLRKKIIKEFGIKSVEDSFTKLKGLWSYGFEWLQIKEISKNKQKSRWKDDNRWIYLRENASLEGSEPVKRIRAIIKKASADRVIIGGTGYFTSFCAINKVTDIKKGIRLYERAVARHFYKKKTSFEKVVLKKMEKMRI